MKGLFKNFSFVLVSICLITSCGCLVKTSSHNSGVVYGTSMKSSYVMKDASQFQLDSICTADSLPKISEWNGSTFTDFETKSVLVKRIYIKQNDGNQIFYIVIGTSEPYNIERRITE